MTLTVEWPRGLAAVVVVGVLAPLALGLAWVVSRAVESPLRSDAPPEPLVVAVGSATTSRPAPVVVTVEYSEPFPVLAAASGTATGVHVAPGDEWRPEIRWSVWTTSSGWRSSPTLFCGVISAWAWTVTT